VIPITLLILALLFFIQRSGTHVVGKLFGPIMVVWFLALGALGLINLVQAPGILKAINPSTRCHSCMTTRCRRSSCWVACSWC
jgi:KUP system potassium uptake protein